MGMPDKLRGVEALTTLPFRDTVLKQDVATWKLTYRTVSVFQTNCNSAINHVAENRPHNSGLLQRLSIRRDNPQDFLGKPGGLALDKDDLETIYMQPAQVTFADTMQNGLDGIVAGIRNPALFGSKNPGIMGVSFMLDLLRIIDPKMASYNDGVDTILRTWRNGKYFPDEVKSAMVLGAMLDDTITRRSTKPGQPDFFADSDGALELRDALILRANPKERIGLLGGLTIPRKVFVQDLSRMRAQEN